MIMKPVDDHLEIVGIELIVATYEPSGDAGGTEPSDPTRRYGVDVEASWDITPEIAVDANVAIARSTVVRSGLSDRLRVNRMAIDMARGRPDATRSP